MTEKKGTYDIIYRETGKELKPSEKGLAEVVVIKALEGGC